MVDGLIRAFRAMRRPAEDLLVAGRIDATRWERDADSRYCGASGWQMRAGVADGRGGTICPLCGRRVRTQPSTVGRRGVEVIAVHTA